MKRRNTTGNNKPAGQRQLRVGERMRHILAGVLRRGDLYDPALGDASLITVSAVDIGPDLKHAVAFVMPLGGKNTSAVVEALNRASGYFRTEVGRELDLRHAPKISFKADSTFDRIAQIEELLNREEVARDLAKNHRDDE